MMGIWRRLNQACQKSAKKGFFWRKECFFGRKTDKKRVFLTANLLDKVIVSY
jgi:hypothetical protein